MKPLFSILIVENDIDLASLVKRKLARENLKGDIVTTGAEAISHVLKNPMTLLLLDHSLPDMYSKNVVDTLNNKVDQVYFIIITGQGDEKLAVDMMKLGARDYLVKDKGFMDRLCPTVTRVFKEITNERKLAETQDALKKSQEMLHSVMENTTAVIFIKDTEGRYLMVNSRYEKLFHVNKNEITGKTDHDVFPKEIADVFRVNDKKVLKANKPLELEESFIQDDGMHTYISIKFPLYDSSGKPYALCGIATDITDRKRREELHKRTLGQLQTSIQQMPNAYIIWDPEFRVLEWNNAAERIFGYTKKNVLGKKALEMIVPAGNRPLVKETTNLLLSGHASSFSEKDNNLRKDGTLISCNWHNTPLKDKQGKVIAILSMAEEVTERLQTEEALRNIATRFFSGTGKDFFNEVASHLQKTLNVDYASICELTGKKKDRIKILGIYGKDKIMGPFEYDLAHTPCENIIKKNTCIYYSEAQKQFPRFPLLADMGIESYLGTPLTNHSGKPIGVMALWNTAPLTNRNIAKSTLNIFAERVSSEIERYKSDEALHHKTKLIQLLQEIAFTANEASTVEEAMRICLDKVCLFTGWSIGHVYLTDPTGQSLIPSKIWYHAGHPLQFEKFRKLTDMTLLNKGVGLPGRVLEMGKPAWISDLTKDPNFPRAKTVLTNLKAGFAFPVLEGTKVVAVLEFFSEESMEPDNTLLETLSNLAVQLGRVTERKRAEESLRKLNNAIDQAGDMVVITDSNGTIEYVNSALNDITGYSKDEVLGKNPRIWSSEKHDKAFFTELWQTILSGKIWHKRIINKNKNGQLITLEQNISPIMDDHRKITHYVSIMRDITKELLMEEKLQQAMKLEALGTMVGGIAHDFNNILTSIIGFSELTLQDRELKSQNRDYVNVALKNAYRAKDIVSQLLVFARKTNTDKSPVNIAEIVGESLKMLRSFLPTTILIEEDIGPGPYLISANTTQLEQVIMNLAINAGHAMPDGGTLSLKLKNANYDKQEIMAGKILSGPYVLLSIEDTGLGMNNQTKSRIFDPFFTTKEEGKGTGLGLSTTYSIIKQHKGDITVESEEGKGTTFTIFLPAIGPTTKVFSEKIEYTLTSCGDESILFIDDEESIIALAKKSLESLGYSVKCFNKSLEALKVFRHRPEDFDLVITDQIMPYMTGEKLAKELLKIRKDIPIIISSGHSENINEEKASKMGIKAFIMKPYGIESLANTVADVLNQTVRAGGGLKKPASLALPTEPMVDAPGALNLFQNTSARVSTMTSDNEYIVNIEGEYYISNREKRELLDYYVKAKKEGKNLIVSCTKKVEKDLKEMGFDKFLSING